MIANICELSPPLQELKYLEVFAGVANVWRAVSSSYPAARVDLTYCEDDPNFKQNPMNILSSAGFAIPSSTNLVSIEGHEHFLTWVLFT